MSVFLLCSLFVSAAPIYLPGETLDPDCGPDDPDCTVAPPALSGINTNITELSALTDATTTNLVVSSILRLPFLEGTILGVDQNGNVIATTTLVADPSWGAIGGALSAQTDLQNALDAKSGLSTNNTFSLHNIFTSLFVTNASTTNATTSALGLTSLATPAGTFLAVNPDGTVVATSTPSVLWTAETGGIFYDGGKVRIGVSTSPATLTVSGGISSPMGDDLNNEAFGAGAYIANAAYNGNTVIGAGASVTEGFSAGGSTVIGAWATSTHAANTVIGANSKSGSGYSVVIGNGLVANSQYSVLVGSSAGVSNNGSVAIGYSAYADEAHGIAIGRGVNTDRAYQTMFGSRYGEGINPSLTLMGSTANYQGRNIFDLTTNWLDSTDATRRGQVMFSTENKNGSVEFMRVDATDAGTITQFLGGNVGIGTTSPFSTLSITGKPGTSPFTVASSSGDVMFTMLENGNVGIGKSDPQYTIDIAGTINAIAIRTPYEHTITVAKTGGDYTTITEALNAITDNDATHLYHIKVMPGVYEESITMKPYVDISGSGENSTVISGASGIVVTPAANSLLEKVKITRTAAGAVRGVSGSNADNFILRDVNINVTSTDNAAYGVSVDSGSANVVIEDVQMTVTGQGTIAGAYGIFATNTSIVYVYNSRISVAKTGNKNVVGIFSYETDTKVYVYNSDVVVVQDGSGSAMAIDVDSGGADIQFVSSNLTVTSKSPAHAFYFGQADGIDTTGLIVGSKVSVTGSDSTNAVVGIGDLGDSGKANVTVRDSMVTATNLTGYGYGVLNTNGAATKIFDSEITGIGYGSGKFGRAINVKFGTGPFYVQNSKLTGTGNSSASGQGVYVSSGGNLTLINNQISGSTKDIVIDAGGTVNSSFNTYTSLTNNGTFRDVSSDLTTGNFLVSGNVGIGTTSPFSTLSITGKPGTSPFTVASSSGSTMFTMLENGNVGIGTSTPAYALQVYIDSSNEGHVAATGDWARTSDISMKKNVLTLEGALEKVMQLRGVRYDWVADEDAENSAHIGFIAQEVEAIFPEFVDAGTNGLKGVSYGAFTPVLLQAIKEQQGIILAMTGASTTGLIFASSTNAVEDRLAEITDELPDDFVSYFEEKISNIFKLTKEFVAERMTAMIGHFGFVKTVKIHSVKGYETIDKATGETYCIYMENGEMRSVLGACDEVSLTESKGPLLLQEPNEVDDGGSVEAPASSTPSDEEETINTTIQPTEDLEGGLGVDTATSEVLENNLEANLPSEGSELPGEEGEEIEETPPTDSLSDEEPSPVTEPVSDVESL